MKIYNSLTKKKEEFIPLEEGKVKMYACGITVSGEAHIGHGYQALIYDIMRKFLKKSGYEVTYARNYTDVDDKIIAKSHETGIPADEYAANMIENINKIMSKFNVDDPDVWLKATENIDNIIEFVSTLIEKGHAYPTKNGDVYFDVASFPGYGKLSNRNVEDALDGVRVDNDDEKKNAYDFALWKSAKEGEIFWESPWGKGRPGWHIECSAMNRAAFGEQIDIHGGGRDLIFPHHENEIAQTEALTGKQFVKYWTHNGLIKVNGQKMSKSLGNSLLLNELLEKYSDEAVKFALLQTNYRNDINITDELFPEAEKHLYEFYSTLALIDKVMDKLRGNELSLDVDAAIKAAEAAQKIDHEFNACMSDDFNTALALSNLFGYFKDMKKLLADGKSDSYFTALSMAIQLRKTYSLLGLFQKSAIEYTAWYEEKNVEKIPADVKAVAEERWAARAAKDWAKSDELRNKLAEMGYAVKDSKTGYELTKN
ncbi:MAG: cysteine--tRNA ligase [Clostridia bacterium]|nr:cysteine--tRNA ligase [Clostridia bacterium]MBQ9113991.1 cysteine--tRNA ligase [Clostridia bacterium]